MSVAHRRALQWRKRFRSFLHEGGRRQRSLEPGDVSNENGQTQYITPRSLCQDKDGKLDCAQPSWAILDKWQDLDWDGDGYWTREEAMADKANLACSALRGTSVEEVFYGVVRGLRVEFAKLAQLVSKDPPLLPPSISLQQAIPKVFFDFWRGIDVLCSARDVGRCGALVQEGLFDVPLSTWRATGGKSGFQSTMDALDFCQRVLDGSTCEEVHPVTYTMWMHHTVDMCGPGSMTSLGHYKNPFAEDDFLDFAHFSYGNIHQFAKANSLMFRFFMCLILFIWLASLFGELGGILQLADFSFNFPRAEGESFSTRQLISKSKRKMRSALPVLQVMHSFMSRSTEGQRSPRDVSKRMTGITRPHRIGCFVVVFLRAFLVVYMIVAGSIFLLRTYSYTDLLLNVVALSFVFELPLLLYVWFVNPKCKDQLAEYENHDDGNAPLVYASSLPSQEGIKGMIQSNDFWSLVLLPIGILLIVNWNKLSHTKPILEALECACMQTGPRCLTAEKLNLDWFSTYWQQMASEL